MATVGNGLEAGEGNTNTSPARTVPSRFWCFTLNNYTKVEMETLEAVCNAKNIEYCFGEEIGAQGTPHLQGFIKSKKNIRPSETFKNKRIHWEKCKGNEQQNLNYVKKDGVVHTNMTVTVKDPMDGLELFDWQRDILDLVNTAPDQRSIHWYWDEQGCTGKTTFAKHLCLKHDAIYVNGKAADVKFAIAEMNKKPKVVIFGFPRSSEDYVSYASLEEVKDGMFFSTKFESGMSLFNPPHVIVFANFAPDERKLSKDRWHIVKIKPHV